MTFRSRRSKKQYKDTSAATTIDADHHKLHTANDPGRLAMIFFPHNSAKMKRAAFLAIFFELRNAAGQRLQTLNHIPDKYGISHSCFTKARAKMKRIGLISQSQGDWIFSGVFEGGLSKLMDHIDSLKRPAMNSQEREMESFYVEATKSIETLKQWRLREKHQK